MGTNFMPGSAERAREWESFLIITPVHLYGRKGLSRPYLNKQAGLGIEGCTETR